MAMKRINFIEESTGVKVDDPAVQRAMDAYDHLNDDERRDTYRSTIQAMTAYRRTGDEAYLTRLTRTYEETIRIDAIPGLREKIRAQRDAPPPEPGDVMPAAEAEALIARLHGAGEHQ